MKKIEQVAISTEYSAEVASLRVSGQVTTHDGKLVGTSRIRITSDDGQFVDFPLRKAKRMLAELTSIVDEMSATVQRKTTVKEHERPGYTVREHERKIPLGRKDVASELPKFDAGTDTLTASGTPRMRRRNMTKEEVLDIRRLAKEGFGYSEIAEAYDRDVRIISKIVRKVSYKNA